MQRRPAYGERSTECKARFPKLAPFSCEHECPGFTEYLWEGTLPLTLSMAGDSHLVNHHVRLFWMSLGSAKFWDKTQ